MRVNRLFVFVLLMCGLCAASAQGALRVGAARVDQTGPLGPSQSGKYDHEKVYARAIVLENGSARAALIAYEGPAAFGVGATLKAVAAELNCPVENLIITHTHTHSPTFGGMGSSGGLKPTAEPSKEVLDAVRQAKAKLQPAKMGYGTGAAYLNVNRDAIDPASRKWVQGTNQDAFSDKTVGVLTFEKPTGEPIAVYVNYAMHPVDGYVVGALTADFPGAMSRYVEKAFGDNIVVAFTQGASGDQNPLYLRPSTNAMTSRGKQAITGFQMNREASEGPLRMVDSAHPAPPADPKVVDDLFQFIQSEGQVLGEEVIRVMTFTKNFADNVRIEGLQTTVTCPGRKRTNGDNMDPATREGVDATYVDAPPVTLRPGIIALGTVALASINGEVYSLISKRIKDEAPMKDTMVVTVANERVNGYIPDDSAYGHQTFQVLNSPYKPGCAERGLSDAIVRMETQYMNGK